MENAPTAIDLTYEGALEVLLGFDSSYSGGLSNHGPMAVEALTSMGMDHWIGPFVTRYRRRLETPGPDVTAAPLNWQEWLRPQLAELVPDTANLAGHGLLRVAHAVRGLERSAKNGEVSEIQRVELAAAVEYWRGGGPGLSGPSALNGEADVAEWGASIARLPIDQRSDGFLTLTFATAAATPDFARVGELAPGTDPGETLDALATVAAAAFARNEASAAFALLHGTTVSAMARVLLPHLDDVGQRRLEAAVAGFVAAALIGFDLPETDGSTTDEATLLDPSQLTEAAAASHEDHTIKFADACIGVFDRTGEVALLGALDRQITKPYGL